MKIVICLIRLVILLTLFLFLSLYLFSSVILYLSPYVRFSFSFNKSRHSTALPFNYLLKMYCDLCPNHICLTKLLVPNSNENCDLFYCVSYFAFTFSLCLFILFFLPFSMFFLSLSICPEFNK